MIFWLTVAASGVATYLVRTLPLVLAIRGPVPPVVARYLDALPTAIIAALAGAGVLAPGDRLTSGPEVVAAAAVVAVVAWRRNLLAGMLVGIATIALLRAAGAP